MESAVRETLASILSLSLSPGQSSSLEAVFYSIGLRRLYFDRGKIKMNDISA